MSTEKISSLQDLENRANDLEAECREGRSIPSAYVSPILFRGHARSDWCLETTLERFGKRYLTLDSYNRYLAMIIPAIESYTGQSFEFDYRNSKTDGPQFVISDVRLLKGQYEFMVYLRHHGFPTPLLDWSRSLYVALYFACSGGYPKDDGALYMYVENLGHGKGGVRGAPEIAALGQYVSAHKRHFVQQSQYTACVAQKDKDWCFYPHESTIGNPSDMQDRLVKVVIPSELKAGILRKLDMMNINAFSLFGTEEALMETLAFRELGA